MRVVVTGASQGIGAAIAEAFAAEPSARIELVSRRADALERVAERCRASGAEARVHTCDVTRDADVEATAASLLADGAPDVLVNNAGRFLPGAVLEIDPARFREQVDVNLTSSFLVTRALLPSMIAAGRGHVFYLGSVASLRAYPGAGAYCAAKHGLLGLARAVREETRQTAVRVTTLLPGATLTPSWDGVDLPEDRFIPAADVARTMVDCYRLGPNTVVEELLLRPQPGDV